MTSSLSRFLGTTPTTFGLDLEFVPLTERDGESAQKVAEVTWTDSESWESPATKLRETLVALHGTGMCERCQVELEVTSGGEVTVEMRVWSDRPSLRSLVFTRASGSSLCDERYLMRVLDDLDVTSVTRLQWHEGFPFFVPAVVPAEKWKQLSQLHLINAGIVALPAVLGQYSLLRELRLSHNTLTTLPREIGFLKHLEMLAVDHNRLQSVPADLCDCVSLCDLNVEFNNLSTVVLNLKKFPKLHSLQLYGNPLKYIPELSVCQELRSLSLMNLRVWSDASYSRFEVTIEGTTSLSSGTKLNPLFGVIFSRSSSQHPLLAGALGRLAEFQPNCDAILEQPGAPLKQLILMALSPHSVVQEQAAKVIGLMANTVKIAETLVENEISSALLSVLNSERQETKCYALKALSVLAMTADDIATHLLVPQLIEKLQRFIAPSTSTAVRHMALEALGNFSFAVDNKKALLQRNDIKEVLRNLAHGQPDATDRKTRLLACRCLAILGESEEVELIVGRQPIKGRGVRILSIDGGGMKGLAAVKMLKEIEDRTGRHIADLFDLIGGTSSGAMLAVALGILQLSLEHCDDIYKTLGRRVFNQAHQEDQAGWKDGLFRMYRSGQQGLRVVMAGSKHDAQTFEMLLQEMCHQLSDKAIGSLYIDSAVLPGPKVFAASTLTSITPAVPFLFRNYELSVHQTEPKANMSSSLGSSKFDLWQGVRASSAAPYFFEDFKLGGLHFQDGATTANNPTVLAVQQAKLLWPDKPIDCVVSIGLGAVPVAQREKSTSSFIENGNVLIESACSVERVHEVMLLMASMMPEMQYFRFSPVDKRCDLALDDLDAEKWSQLEAATMDYIEKNNKLFIKAAETLLRKTDPTTPLAKRDERLFVNEDCPLVVVTAAGEKSVHGALHFADYCAGTVDIGNQFFCRHVDYKGTGMINLVHSFSEPAETTDRGAVYLQELLSAVFSRHLGALHLDLQTTDSCKKLILKWRSFVWSISDPSKIRIRLGSSRSFLFLGPEADSLRSALQLESGASLSEALVAQSTFMYVGSPCRLITQQHFHAPTPSTIYVFERSESSDVLSADDIPSLSHFVKDAVITCPQHLADCLIGKFLSSGAKAVVCLGRHSSSHSGGSSSGGGVGPSVHDANCFFTSFYNRVYAGHEIRSSFKQVESLLPNLKNMYQLFY